MRPHWRKALSATVNWFTGRTPDPTFRDGHHINETRHVTPRLVPNSAMDVVSGYDAGSTAHYLSIRNYGLRPHQLVDARPSQKQQPEGDHNRKIGDEAT